jgi:hypothetical protein
MLISLTTWNRYVSIFHRATKILQIKHNQQKSTTKSHLKKVAPLEEEIRRVWGSIEHSINKKKIRCFCKMTNEFE